jgi:putative DNA primase/helicase
MTFKSDSYDNPVESFRMAMADAGINTDAPIVADGVLHRFHVDGHSRGTLNGAYTLHGDARPAGWFMDHKSGVSRSWSANGQYRLSKDDLKVIEQERARRASEQAEMREKALVKAMKDYEAAKPCESHQYLTAKNVPPLPTLRVDARGTLLVPMWDDCGALVSLQRIYWDGNHFQKRFEKGCAITGAMFWFGGHTDTLRICEGLATGLSIHKETGDAVYVAFNAGNLLAVAKTLRDCFPNHRIILCADNDEDTPGNPGLTKAKEAAEAVGAELSVPPISGDWNDFLNGGAA